MERPPERQPFFSRERFTGRFWHRAGALGLAAVLTAAACGGDDDKGVTAIFDDAGGGSRTIEVYPGVSESVADKRYNHTYEDDEDIEVDCQVKGRRVNSVTGEEERSDETWVHIFEEGEHRFATAVYLRFPDDNLDTLDDCRELYPELFLPEDEIAQAA